MLRIIHTADVHLGARHDDLGEQAAAQRERQFAAFVATVDLAIAEIAALRAGSCLPRATVHVISDVHGEYKKLRHVINNASGSLRPLVEELFGRP